jgi:hypothetical protein
MQPSYYQSTSTSNTSTICGVTIKQETPELEGVINQLTIELSSLRTFRSRLYDTFNKLKALPETNTECGVPCPPIVGVVSKLENVLLDIKRENRLLCDLANNFDKII